MASIIRIKRSNSSSAPSILGNGELAYSAGSGTQANGGERLYIGFGTEIAGSAPQFIIGGKYFTDLLDHTHGTLTANSALIVDGDKKLDNLKVDNLDLNGNTISSTDTNGNIVLAPNGSGHVLVSGTNGLVIPSGTTVQQGPAITGTIRFNTTTSQYEGYNGTNWTSMGGVRSVDGLTYIIAESSPGASDDIIHFYAATGVATSVEVAQLNATKFSLLQNTTSTSTTTGALTVAGGVGIVGSVYIGGSSNITGDLTVSGILNSDDITSTNISISGNATITGNLTVQGTTTTVNSTAVAISDINLTLAKDATTAAEANGAGLTVAGANATILYSSATDDWAFNKNVNLPSLTVTNGITGNASSATKWATARDLSLTGDATATLAAVDGTANVSTAITFATVNANVGTFGDSTTVPTFTVNAKGLITAASQTAIPIATTTINGLASFDTNNFTVTSGLVSINVIDGGTF